MKSVGLLRNIQLVRGLNKTIESAYKYSWQCTSGSCGKIYGRHSKSIDPAKHACGACAGLLVQLDKDRKPIPTVDTAKTPKKESEWQIYSKVSLNHANKGAASTP